MGGAGEQQVPRWRGPHSRSASLRNDVAILL